MQTVLQRAMTRQQYAAGLENDEYVRQIDGYLPTCEVAFIDEIFKANSAILNALLTLLNERLFDNGNQRLRVPLLCMVSRSITPHCRIPDCPLCWWHVCLHGALALRTGENGVCCPGPPITGGASRTGGSLK